MTTYHIYPIPAECRGNEYLEHLHAHTQGKWGDSLFKIEQFSWKNIMRAHHAKNERHVLHIHWETNVYGSRYILLSFIRMAYRIPSMWLLKLRGAKIIWTMHNKTSHDYPHPFVDHIGRCLIRHLADVVTIHTKTFADEEAAYRKNKRIVFLPQGNYIGVYGPLWHGDRTELRKEFAADPKTIILLALGSIRPYKALPELIKVLSESNQNRTPIHLIIAGQASPEYERIIREKIRNMPFVTLKIGFIPHKDISRFFAVADYSIFYYSDSSLHSAAVLLSLSYGTPVIMRDIPASEMIIRDKNGFVFHDATELKEIVLKLPETAPFDRNIVIGTVADTSWEFVGKRLREVYTSLWSSTNTPI